MADRRTIDVDALVATMSETEIREALVSMIHATGDLMQAINTDAPIPRAGRSAVDLAVATLALNDREIDHHRSALARRDVELATLQAEHESTCRSWLEMNTFLEGVLSAIEPHVPRLTPRTVKGVGAAVGELRARLDRLQPLLSVLGDWDWRGIARDGFEGDVDELFATIARALAHVEEAEELAAKERADG